MAAAIGNASAFRINSDQGLSYFNRSSNQSQFNVSPDGVLDAKQIGAPEDPVDGLHSKIVNTRELFTNRIGASKGHSRPPSLTAGGRQYVQPKPAVVIMYDDGNVEEYTDAFEVHKQYGLPGTTGMIPPRFGADGALTQEQLQEMEDWGWGVSCHNRVERMQMNSLSGDHSQGTTRLTFYGGNDLSAAAYADTTPDYTYHIVDSQSSNEREIIQVDSVDTTTSPPEVIIKDGLSRDYLDGSKVWMTRRAMEREIGGAKQRLLEKGFTTSTFIYSGNVTGGPVGRSVASQYFDYARSDHDDDGINELPLNQYSLSSQPLEPGGMAGYLDDVEAKNGLGIIYTHIKSDNVSNRRGKLHDLLSELQSRDIDVLTLDEATARFGGASNYNRPAETDRVAWYPFLGGEGPVRDVSGTHDGTWAKSPSYVTTEHGTGASFDYASGNQITIPHSPKLNPGTESFSVVATIQVTDYLNTEYKLGKSGGGANWRIGINPAGFVQCRMTDSSGSPEEDVRESYPFDVGSVVQICFVRDADDGVLRLFINASHDRAGPNEVAFDGSANVNPTGDLALGAKWDGELVSSYNLFDLQIYNRVIEREELVNWEDQTLPPSYHENDVRSGGAGNGIVVTTPDGSAQYRIRVDNTGSVMTEEI